MYVDVQTVQLTASNVVTWYAHANWRNVPGTMVDNFKVKVGGEIVWSTGTKSRIYQKNFSCSDSSSTCFSTQEFTVSGVFAGVALGKVRLSLLGNDILSSLSSKLSVQTSGTNTVTIEASCGIGSAPGVDCEHRAIVVSALATEMEPFTSSDFAYAGTMPFLSGQVQSQVGLSRHREMACGLREFVTEVAQPGGYLGAFRIGAMPTDCGFNGTGRGFGPAGWSYGGVMRHDFRIPSLTYSSRFKLDGAKLVWP